MGSIHLLFLSSANPERLRIRQVNVMKHRFQLLTIYTRRLATIERPRIPESCGSDGAEPSRCRSETCLTLWNVPWLGGPPVEQLTGPWRAPSLRSSSSRFYLVILFGGLLVCTQVIFSNSLARQPL